jgi:hypothetical protein
MDKSGCIVLSGMVRKKSSVSSESKAEAHDMLDERDKEQDRAENGEGCGGDEGGVVGFHGVG